jgi:tyrosinase
MQDDYKNQQRSLHDHVAQAYRTNTLEAFSHTVEEAHGWIHGIIGGGWNGKRSTGHMWPLEYSAYEPMFMLHHAHVAAVTLSTHHANTLLQ